jgi:hypothetical protein
MRMIQSYETEELGVIIYTCRCMSVVGRLFARCRTGEHHASSIASNQRASCSGVLVPKMPPDAAMPAEQTSASDHFQSCFREADGEASFKAPVRQLGRQLASTTKLPKPLPTYVSRWESNFGRVGNLGARPKRGERQV